MLRTAGSDRVLAAVFVAAVFAGIVVLSSQDVLQVIGWSARPMVAWAVAPPYETSLLTFDYFQNGFVKRGLQGTLARLLGIDAGDPALGSRYFAFCVAWALIPFAVLSHRSLRSSRLLGGWLTILLLLSPQLFRGWATDVGRGDTFVVGCIAWSVLAASDRRPLIAAVALLVGWLAHDMAVIVGVPVVLAVLYRRAGAAAPRQAAMLLGALATGLVLSTILYGVLGDPAADVYRTMTSHLPGERGAPYFTLGGIRTIVTSQCESFLDPGTPAVIVASMIVIACYPIILMTGRDKLPSILLVSLAPFCASCLVGIDYGRWTMFAVANAWMLAAVLLQDGPPAGPVRDRLAIAGAVLLALVLQGPASEAYPSQAVEVIVKHVWGVPAPFPARLRRCDPSWQRVAAGLPGRRAPDR